MNNQTNNKKKFSLAGLLGRSKMRYGTYTAILIAVVLVAVILINLAIGAVEDKWALSIDLTSTKVTDFSDATRQILHDLDQDVNIYTVISSNSSASNSNRIKLEEIVNKYGALSSHVHVGNIDPVANPTLATKYAGGATVSDGSIIVTNADESRVRYLSYQDLYTQVSNPINNATYTVDVAERRITTAIAYVSSERTPHVYYLTGHGEFDAMSYCTLLNEQLKDSNYEVSALDLDADGAIMTPGGDTLVIIDPQRDMTNEQYELVRNWMDEGGRLLVSLSYNVDTALLPNFTRLLSYYGLSYDDGFIVEDSSASSNWNGQPYVLVPNLDAESEVTADMATNKHYTLVPYARPVAQVEMPESGFIYTSILTSSNKAVVQDGDEISLPGTKIVALTADKPYFDNAAQSYVTEKEIRIALLGSYYVFADTQYFYTTYNNELMTNLFDWLVNQQLTLPVYSKGIPDTTLRIPDATTAWTLAALVVAVIPLLCLAAGIYVWIKRRRL